MAVRDVIQGRIHLVTKWMGKLSWLLFCSLVNFGLQTQATGDNSWDPLSSSIKPFLLSLLKILCSISRSLKEVNFPHHNL